MRGEALAQRGFVEVPVTHHQHVVQQHAFLVDMRAACRHRARCDAADIRMMRAAGDEELQYAVVVAPRADRGDVRQVRATCVRTVQQQNVGVAKIVAGLQHMLHACAHRAEMNRHVRCVGDQPPLRVEQRAREVEPLLDVDGVRRAFQHLAHVFGDLREAVVEDLEHDGLVVVARLPRARTDGAQEPQAALVVAPGLPAGIDDDRRARRDEDRRPVDDVRADIVETVHAGIVLLPVTEQPARADRRRRPLVVGARLPDIDTVDDDLADAQRGHLRRRACAHAEALFVRQLEVGDHR